jgi:hypothetical protein
MALANPLAIDQTMRKRTQVRETDLLTEQVLYELLEKRQSDIVHHSPAVAWKRFVAEVRLARLTASS